VSDPESSGEDLLDGRDTKPEFNIDIFFDQPTPNRSRVGRSLTFLLVSDPERSGEDLLDGRDTKPEFNIDIFFDQPTPVA
jgi:hypothetical protein